MGVAMKTILMFVKSEAESRADLFVTPGEQITLCFEKHCQSVITSVLYCPICPAWLLRLNQCLQLCS